MKVGEPLPSKQGLKPALWSLVFWRVTVGEPLPSKQGLKHRKSRPSAFHIAVGEPLPSKQGLKPVDDHVHPERNGLSVSPFHQNKD